MAKRQIGSVLVFARDPIIAALVGMLVELTGREPAFARPGERYVDTLRRVRPAAMVLVDVSSDEARSDIFFAAAGKVRVPTVIFGAESRARDIGEIAADRGIPWFTIPPDPAHLAAALEAASGGVRLEASDRRRPDEVVHVPDGTQIFSDSTGCRWMAYDRRATSARREADRGGVVDRVFVSEAGVTRTVASPGDRLIDLTPDALAQQLARATGPDSGKPGD